MVAQADDTVALAGDHNLGELQDGVIGSAKRRSSERASSLASLMSLSTTPRRSWISWGPVLWTLTRCAFSKSCQVIRFTENKKQFGFQDRVEKVVLLP